MVSEWFVKYALRGADRHVVATGRPTKPLILGPEEQLKLELMARPRKTGPRTALRARIVRG